jgi:predicted amidohydrolase YtcJ
MAADVVFRGGRVFVPGEGPQELAVAVEGELISAVGPEREVMGLTSQGTEVIDVGGRLLCPGFIDAHVHPLTGGLKRLRCDLADCAGPSEALAAVASYAADHPEAEWIWGGGWAIPWFPGGTPAAGDLDRVVPDRPALLYNADGHGAWVNSVALALAGIDAATPDPVDGRIERLADGSPQGTLHEGAVDLVERFFPPPTAADWEAGLAEGQRYLLSFGITGWQDASVEVPHDAAYLALAGRGELKATVVGALWWQHQRGRDQIEELLTRRAAMAPRYRPTTVKLMLDGIAENFTASMLAPYLDGQGRPTANRGLDFIAPDELPEIVAVLDRLGFQCHFHAIGDRAARHALDAVEHARRVNGDGGPLHHVAHLQVVDPADRGRFAPLRVAANMQALWACNEPQLVEHTLPFLGPDQRANHYPFASLLRAGALVAAGSDWSVSTPNVMAQVEMAVHRGPFDTGDPFLPGEALTLVEALTAFTAGSSAVNGLAGIAGTIAEGSRADLALLSADPFREDAIGDITVDLTVARGEVVYRA